MMNCNNTYKLVVILVWMMAWTSSLKISPTVVGRGLRGISYVTIHVDQPMAQRNKWQLAMSKISDFENVTRSDLIFNVIQRQITDDVNVNIGAKLDSLSAQSRELKAEFTTQYKELKEDFTTQSRELKAEFTTQYKELNSKLDNLRGQVQPLQVIYTLLVFAAGSVGTFILMKIDWNELPKLFK
jgi:preprotein translocase subunit SecD